MSVALMHNEVVYPQVEVASRITGSGMFVPERVVTNEHFAAYLETSDEWIRERTGIVERRWAGPEATASSLAEPAARQAIANAGLTVDDIDGIVFATVTPDSVFPSSACYLQKRLGVKRGFAFDVNAVCSGFIYALVTADSMIGSGCAKHVLVVGSELYSRIIDPNDRTTCVLFGDGAGAVVLSACAASDTPGVGRKTVKGSAASLRGIYRYELGADGAQTDILHVPCGTACTPTPESLARGEHYLRMQGREVFKLAVRKLGEINERIVAEAGIPLSEVDYFLSHQANSRILLAMADKVGAPAEKVLINVNRFGNTSAASLPILLAEAEANGTLRPGHLVVLSAFGGGVTWGSVLLRF